MSCSSFSKQFIFFLLLKKKQILNCRSSRKSLDYTKQSLRISIDLGKREEESETWLQVGRIYYLVQEDELADMYLQVRMAAETLPLCAAEQFVKYFLFEEPHIVF